MIIKPDQMRSAYPGSPEEIDESIESARGMINSIKNEKDETIMKFSLKSGALSLLFAPKLAAIGAITAMAKDWTIIVEKKV